MLIIYFSIYSILTLPIIIICKQINLNYINNLTIKSKFISSSIIISILSLGGLPPFIGFLPKIMVIQNTINLSIQITFITITLIISTLIILYIYIHITFNLISINSSKKKWEFIIQEKNSKKLNLISIINITNCLGLLLLYLV